MTTYPIKRIEKYLWYTIYIWWHPYWTHTHSWIHHRFYRAFQYLGFDVKWLINSKTHLPEKNEKCIIITENSQDLLLLEHYSNNWIIFDHSLSYLKYLSYDVKNKNIFPFGVIRYNLAKFTEKTFKNLIIEWDTPKMSMEEYYYSQRQIKILWGTHLLPHEIKFTPYRYSDNRDIVFIWSWWHNNCIELETLRLWSIMNGKKFTQYWKHLLLRPPLIKKKFLPEEEIEKITRSAYISPAVQWEQVNDGYIPCRLFMNMSMSVLGVSNNPYVYNLFDDDEVIVERDIFRMMEKAEKIIIDKNVDSYTRKAIEKVKNQHTYLNRIEELFSYL